MQIVGLTIEGGIMSSEYGKLEYLNSSNFVIAAYCMYIILTGTALACDAHSSKRA